MNEGHIKHNGAQRKRNGGPRAEEVAEFAALTREVHDPAPTPNGSLNGADNPVENPKQPTNGLGFNAEAQLMERADKLSEESTGGQVGAVLKLLVEAQVSAAVKNRVLARIKKNTKQPIPELRRELAPFEKKAKGTQRKAERLKKGDRRPEYPVPAPQAEWLPQIGILNKELGRGRESDPEPPMRDVDGFATGVFVRRAIGLHTLTPEGANADEESTRLPALEQPLLSRLSEEELAELIEGHIAYVDEDGELVHLGGTFVKHYLWRRNDPALPVVKAVSTLPLVLTNGKLLSARGLDRKSGFVFRVPLELMNLLPRAEDCNDAAIREAQRFLTDEWLCDVTTDYAGKCVAIACALTVIERLVLVDRPAFLVTAAQRGGGKTTLLNMVSMAVLGIRATAGAWALDENERRKALFSYLLEGLPFLVWDNLPRGSTIACPSIEKALTAETYSDRILGASRAPTISSTTIMAFTGNNIVAGGDMASRTLKTQIEVNRVDPENREFKHSDVIAWTEGNRGKILRSLYTILVGNPRFKMEKRPAPETRFKDWWHLIGFPVEYAAGLEKEELSFRKMFFEQDAKNEASLGLAGMLRLMLKLWPQGFSAADLHKKIEDGIDVVKVENGEEVVVTGEGTMLRTAIEQASGKPIRESSVRRLTWQLRPLVGVPAMLEDGTFALRTEQEHDNIRFWVGVIV